MVQQATSAMISLKQKLPLPPFASALSAVSDKYQQGSNAVSQFVGGHVRSFLDLPSKTDMENISAQLTWIGQRLGANPNSNVNQELAGLAQRLDALAVLVEKTRKSAKKVAKKNPPKGKAPVRKTAPKKATKKTTKKAAPKAAAKSKSKK